MMRYLKGTLALPPLAVTVSGDFSSISCQH